jgi:serine/threonine protein kinase/tetratricopeptide (TPR) repeat protein
MASNIASIEAIFSEALEIPSAEARADYLDRACAADPELRRQVESLIAVHDRAGRFLASPTVSYESGSPEPVGSTVGPYKLMEQIGEGGMGVVYVAEQTKPVRRKVALKIIKPGMDTKQVIARFEAERQALAMMDHPNIARVIDAGATESGPPYFVMELVRGISITDYCDREQVAIQERLELFVLVCRAVQHAHQKGIIHRDLKPSNILVTVIDGAAVPKIIDFGVAKATGASLTDRAIYTAFQQFVGTPLYMSPEQADLSGVDIDTRSDIYALGVLLYELLTGTTPFDQETFRQAAFDEVRRIIREEEPAKPSTRLSKDEGRRMKDETKRAGRYRFWPYSSFILHPSSFQELDWIVMKALEKDRRRRYETANDFAADVMRYLTDQPVDACPPSSWYRFTKYARRNRAILTTAGLVGVIVMLSLVGLSVGLVLITRERNRALLLQHQAEERTRWVLREVSRMDEEAGVAFHLGRNQIDPEHAKFVERILTFLEKYVREIGGAPDLRYETALACLRIGRIQDYLRRNEAAKAQYWRALPLWEVLARDRPNDPDCVLNLAGCLMNIGHCETVRKAMDAEPYYRRASRLLELLVTTFPENSQSRLLLANCFVSSGRIRERSGRSDQAEPYYRRALPILAGLTDRSLERYERVQLGYGLYASGHNLASVLIATGRLGDVDRVYGEPFSLLEKLEPDCNELSASLRNDWAWFLATCPDRKLRDPARALELARKAVELAPQEGGHWNTIGVALYRTGDWKAAIEALEKAQSLAPDANLGFDGFFLAMAHWQLGHKDEARTWYDKAVAGTEKNKPRELDLARFRAEAAALLGVADLPADVFARPKLPTGEQVVE